MFKDGEALGRVRPSDVHDDGSVICRVGKYRVNHSARVVVERVASDYGAVVNAVAHRFYKLVILCIVTDAGEAEIGRRLARRLFDNRFRLADLIHFSFIARERGEPVAVGHERRFVVTVILE